MADLYVDAGHANAGVLLAVADGLVEALAALVLDRADLGAFGGAEHVGGDRRATDQRGADLGLALATDQKNPVERDGLFVLSYLPVDQNRVAARHLMLTAAIFNNRVHDAPEFVEKEGEYRGFWRFVKTGVDVSET